MKHTVSEMKHISSSTDNARAEVAEFCAEVLIEARARFDLVKSIVELRSILDSKQLAIAADARAGIRHIHAGVQAVVDYHHHQRGALDGRFDETLATTAKYLDDVEALYSWLDKLYSRN
ncbi:hypothetical protein FAZ97_09200 [Paraburkholderia acidiphila]|uniref:HPt domain-containing protein n=2 Tax=Paraburkholderia acidiphila TaxID=2571747 RepID=A0A7Z2G6U5_9BURK|nr:hypothetical protein FAZ97_09200 [Paraburkholderia acidiphila]